MVAIFTGLAVPARLRHRVLFWGVLGAVVLRGALIAGGASLLERFHWLTYVLGAGLALAALKLTAGAGEGGDGPGRVAAIFRRLVPTVDGYRGASFLVREAGRLRATPLLAALVAVEIADLAFAADSVPAVFSVTRDPFVVFSSNVFAILGLRSLYFALDGAAAKCHALDADGITVYAFATRFRRYEGVTPAKVAQIFRENEPAGGTDLARVLRHAFASYFERKAAGRAKAGGETFVVVTDGKPDDRREVMRALVEASRKMGRDDELGVSLVQVGDDPPAARFLRTLDDDLEKAGAVFDLCDAVSLDALEDLTLTEVLLRALHD